MIRSMFKAFKISSVFLSTIVFATGTSWTLTLPMILGGAGLAMSLPSPAAAQPATKAVVSCWATKAGRDYVRVSWTPANIDNANRYTIKRSRDGGNYYWQSTESNQARSSIVRESSTGNLRYLVESISASGDRATTYCGPDGGLDHDGTSTPVAVASCWATKLENGSYFITWTSRPDDGANRYTVMKSRNRGDYSWADTVGLDKRESNFVLNGAGTYRFQVRTVAKNRAYVVRDCGPVSGVEGVGSRLTVMPVGDSITLGATDRPAYRYPMQEDNRYTDCAIDLVGSAPINWARGEAPSGIYADPMFNHSHASWGGHTVGELLAKVDGQVTTHKPDVVLLHVGTNDILRKDPTEKFYVVSLVDESKPNLRKMIDSIKQNSPSTDILVAKVIRPGAAEHQSRVDSWNAMVAEVVAATGSQTRLVDMDAIWPRLTVGPNLTQAQINENERFWLLMHNVPGDRGVHPSIDGSRVLADQWLKALNNARLCP